MQQIRFLHPNLEEADGTLRQPAPHRRHFVFGPSPQTPLTTKLAFYTAPQSLRANRTPTADIGSPTSDTSLGAPQMVAVQYDYV
ncbi:hypothetical protein B0T26DRAFT_718249, partial [Lasiosphaeria miniovina]